MPIAARGLPRRPAADAAGASGARRAIIIAPTRATITRLKTGHARKVISLIVSVMLCETLAALPGGKVSSAITTVPTTDQGEPDGTERDDEAAGRAHDPTSIWPSM